jgi:predicted nucleic acid-binding protein
MILLDTSILVDYLRAPTQRVLNIMQQSGAAVCGVVRAEVLHGSRNAAHLDRLIHSLDSFHQIGTPEDIWDDLGRNLFLLRSRGVHVPLSDALIATLAIRNGLEVWAEDGHYPLMRTVFPRLRLFVPPDPGPATGT